MNLQGESCIAVAYSDAVHFAAGPWYEMPDPKDIGQVWTPKLVWNKVGERAPACGDYSVSTVEAQQLYDFGWNYQFWLCHCV